VQRIIIIAHVQNTSPIRTISWFSLLRVVLGGDFGCTIFGTSMVQGVTGGSRTPAGASSNFGCSS